MIRRSGGDVDKLEHLREQAIEGAFDTRLCRGLDECSFIPKELRGSVKKTVEKFKEDGDIRSFKDIVKKLKQ